jgi:YidC/Oxa1 family membrane protein insertase
MILAVVLSALVLFGWGFLTQSFMPAANPPAKTEKQAQAPAAQQQQQQQASSAPAARPASGPAPLQCVNRDAGSLVARIPIRTPRLRGSVNLAGARVDDLSLLDYGEGVQRNSPRIRLFSPAGSRHPYHASFGWSGAGVQIPGPDTLWQASGTELTPSAPLALRCDNGRGQIFEIVLRVDRDYLFTAEQRVTNRAAQPVTLAANSAVSRVGISQDPTSWTSHVGPVGLFNGTANYDYDFSTVAEAGPNGVANGTRGGWLGFTDKYWLAAIVPPQSANVSASFRHQSGDAYEAGFSTQAVALGANQWMRTTAHLFAGAKEIAVLNRYTDELGTDLGRSIDWGWFDFIMKPIFALLMWLFFQVGNFGVAIIFLVIIVRLILFPLAQKQFASMAKMRVLQPKVKVLQERYKEDKPRLQQEMMKLYKEERVNPMAGCLPIFLQIPIFYALYKVLLIAVEMRHQPFALWINDLTAPDPLTPINLFGLLPFQPPAFIAIGILPILVGVTMWLQQKMNSAPMDPMQQKIFAWMPWILVVIMAPFAAGFQVYWVTNNLISILQIWFLNRKMDAAAAAGPKPGVALGKSKARASPPPPPPASPPPPSPRPPSPSRPKGRQKSRRR